MINLVSETPVYLQQDITDKDQYGRMLRYVFTDTVFVNAELIEEGLATSFEYKPDVKYEFLFNCLEQEAKQAKRGLWNSNIEYDINIQINYDAEGRDNKNLNGEYVSLTNNGDSVNLESWQIKDEATHIYTFSALEFGTGQTITLYSGSGTDSETEIYWNSRGPIWNNDGDTVFLRDAKGNLAASYSY